MVVLEAQMRAASARFNRLDLTSMTKRQKKIAGSEHKREGEKLEARIANVLKRFAEIDCLVAFGNFVEARAYI